MSDTIKNHTHKKYLEGLTTEQQNIVKSSLINNVTLVNSVAGSGKSHTLKSTAEAHNNYKSRYCVFSKEQELEAKQSFNSNVIISTIDSMNFRYVVTLGLEIDNSTKTLKSERDLFGYPKVVKREFEQRFNLSLITENIPKRDKEKVKFWLEEYCKSRFLSVEDYCETEPKAMKRMTLIKKYMNAMASKKIPSCFDFNRKYMQILTHYNLIDFDLKLLMVDEFQDLNECTLEIVNNMKVKRKVFVGDCMHERTRIRTTEGWERLKTIVNGIDKGKKFYVTSLNESTNMFEPKQISNYKESGIKDTYKIKTSSHSLVVTKEHKLLTETGWRRTKDIQSGDLLRSYVVTEGSLKDNRLLSDQSLQIVYGSILGDGSIQSTSEKVVRLSLGHSEVQKGYLLWKAKAMGITSDLMFSEGGERVIRGKKCVVKDSYLLNSKTFILKDASIENAINKLDVLGLAVLLMDDGSNNNNRPNGLAIRLHINSFTDNQTVQLIEKLKNDFKIESYNYKSRGYNELRFSKEASIKLLNLTKMYLHEEFNSKFHLEENTTVPLNFVSTKETYEVVRSIDYFDTSVTYDITVESNHNFVASHTSQVFDIAGGLVTHNCDQLLFGFAGAVDGFKYFSHLKSTKVNLTKSFRVPVEIAKRIELFGQLYLDHNFTFVGTDGGIINDTTAYLSRTNSTLIQKIVELHRSGTPYRLTRDPKTIFAAVKTIMYLSKKGVYSNSPYAFLNRGVEDYFDGKTTASSLFEHIKKEFSYHVEIQSAMGIVNSLGNRVLEKVIKDTTTNYKKPEYQTAKTLCATSYTLKGKTLGIVHINKDVLPKDKLLALSIEERTVEETQQFNNMYVAFSRSNGPQDLTLLEYAIEYKLKQNEQNS
jgi:intein/homing endonuclease